MSIISKLPFRKNPIKLVCSISEEGDFELERKQGGRYGRVWRKKEVGNDKIILWIIHKLNNFELIYPGLF